MECTLCAQGIRACHAAGERTFVRSGFVPPPPSPIRPPGPAKVPHTSPDSGQAWAHPAPHPGVQAESLALPTRHGRPSAGLSPHFTPQAQSVAICGLPGRRGQTPALAAPAGGLAEPELPHCDPVTLWGPGLNKLLRLPPWGPQRNKPVGEDEWIRQRSIFVELN